MEGRDLSTIVSNRTMRQFEQVLRNNIRVVYINKKFNQVADFLSRNPRKVPGLPDMKKFDTPMTVQQSVNLLFEGTIQDKQLLDLAANGGNYQDYVALLDVIRTGEEILHLGPAHPVRLYSKVFLNLTILDLPT